MLNGLRLRLTLLYSAAALALIVLVGGGTYGLIRAYFERKTDLALEYRLVGAIQARGLPLPADLAAVERDWRISQAQLWPFPPSPALASRASTASDDEEGEHQEQEAEQDKEQGDDEENDETLLDGDLASVIVLALRDDGQLMPLEQIAQPPLDPNPLAASAALTSGSDWRTVIEDDGSRLRLLTYRLPLGAEPPLLQIGRSLTDQDRLLRELLMAVVGLGSVSAALLGGASWWLAGRSLRPAQLAWERQRTFVTNASHELRTPLTLLRASAEALQREQPAARRQILLANVLRECDHMGRLVEDLLLLSRLDAGQLHLQLARIELALFLSELHTHVAPLADARGINLRVTRAQGVVRADPVRLRQIMLIVLDNALTHTPAGGAITLAAEQHGQCVVLSVADTGCGIGPEHLPRVFDRFYRATTTDNDGGSGIGLALAHGLVTAHHGTIRLTSAPGSGTQVSIELKALAE